MPEGVSGELNTMLSIFTGAADVVRALQKSKRAPSNGVRSMPDLSVYVL
jgi:hypothetical protein